MTFGSNLLQSALQQPGNIACGQHAQGYHGYGQASGREYVIPLVLSYTLSTA
jgi:hypothetical protein